jgi:hypothetical protein
MPLLDDHGGGVPVLGVTGGLPGSARKDNLWRQDAHSLGYLAIPDGAAELVFHVLSERHERESLIVTTNLPFGEWTKVFPDPRLAKAVVDRLTHRAHIIDTGTESWRFRHGLTRTKKRPRPSSVPRHKLVDTRE